MRFVLDVGLGTFKAVRDAIFCFKELFAAVWQGRHDKPLELANFYKVAQELKDTQELCRLRKGTKRN